MDIFWELHSDLPREGPGDLKSTARAYAAASDLPRQPKILDIGCGPGMQTLDLAKPSQGEIIAIDFHQPFLDELIRRAKNAGLDKHIQARKMSMFEMDFAPEQFDLVWSEARSTSWVSSKASKPAVPFSSRAGTWLSLSYPGSSRTLRRKCSISGM